MKKLLTAFTLFLILACQQANATDCFCTLGITSFTATPQTAPKTVLVQWTSNGETGSGVNYNIEKSNDGVNFYLIGTVTYKHTSPASYSFTDNCGKPTSTTNTVYYRLTSLGIDGTTKVTIVKTANVSGQGIGTCYATCQTSTGLTGPSNICPSSTGKYSMGFSSQPITWQMTGSTDATLTVGPITNNSSITVNPGIQNESVTLKATLTGCATPFTKTIPIGIQNSLTGTYTLGSNTYPMQTTNFVASGFISGQFQWPQVTGITVTQGSGSTGTGFFTAGINFSFTLASGQAEYLNFSGTGVCGPVTASRAFIQSGGFMMVVSPNPANSTINLSIASIKDASAPTPNKKAETLSNTTGMTRLYLYNFNTGNFIKQWTYKEDKGANYTLDIAGVKKGTYILKLERNNKAAFVKVIIE